jgi:L-rhamnose-H+ transport protein
MPGNLWTGFALTLIAGLLAGNCMLPAKFARRWPWESTWLVFSIMSLIILPWALAFSMVANLARVYSTLPLSIFLGPLLFGAGWGVAQVLFGLSIKRLGMSLGYAIVVGLGALLGTLIPLFVKHSDVAVGGKGLMLFAGVGLMLLGIAVAAWAGRQREDAGNSRLTSRYGAALGIAVLCGILAPMLNYAFAFGEKIAQQAALLGNSSEAAGYAIWPIALLGGFIPNAFYAAFLLSRNKTWGSFQGRWSPDVWCGVMMGILWMGAFAIYGVSSVLLGVLGTSAGWALFQIFMIMTANCSGLLTAEWKGAPRSAKWGLATGLVLLASATLLIAPRS